MRNCTIHSTTATLRSPVSMMASPFVSGESGANSERVAARRVRKPNSILSCRCTGTLVTVSTPNGILRCGPGLVVRSKAPKRWITATSSGSTW